MLAAEVRGSGGVYQDAAKLEWAPTTDLSSAANSRPRSSRAIGPRGWVLGLAMEDALIRGPTRPVLGRCE